MMKDILLKLMFDILKKYIDFAMIYPFCLEGQKLKKVEKFVANLHDKKNVV